MSQMTIDDHVARDHKFHNSYMYQFNMHYMFTTGILLFLEDKSIM